MSEPIDQEREAFERHYRAKHDGFMPSCFDGEYDWNDAQSCWETWQARAAVQPAGVALPDSYKTMRYHANKIFERVDAAGAAYEAGSSGLGALEDAAESALYLRNKLDDMLAAAAPHPVSGEQKPFTYVTVLEGRIQRQGSEAHCQEWANAWNESCGDQGKASVEPLFRSPPAAQGFGGLGYQVIFDAIAAATRVSGEKHVAISVEAFQKSIATHQTKQAKP